MSIHFYSILFLFYECNILNLSEDTNYNFGFSMCSEISITCFLYSQFSQVFVCLSVMLKISLAMLGFFTVHS